MCIDDEHEDDTHIKGRGIVAAGDGLEVGRPYTVVGTFCYIYSLFATGLVF